MRRVLEEDFGLVAILAAWAILVLRLLPTHEIDADTWLTLVGGREIFQHGLPDRNVLTAWGHGDRWVDQQWLAQAFFYGLSWLGGLRLALLTHAALLVLAFSFGAAVARRRGASALAVAASVAIGIAGASGIGELRAEVLAFPLFVALYALLTAEDGRPARLMLALPLLVVWANVHGSVVLGALLTVLRVLTQPRRRSLALIVAAPLAVLASPYGGHLLGYYGDLLFSSRVSHLSTEWQPTKLSAATAPFFLALGLVVWLLGRSGGRSTWFERLALILLAAAALHSYRNAPWFGLAAVVSIPPLIDAAWPRRRSRTRPEVNRLIALAAVGATLVALVVVASRPARWFESRWPRPAAAAAAQAASEHPRLPIVATTHLADWLLWREPTLRGRVAYDARFELLNDAQLHAFDGSVLAECTPKLLVVGPRHRAWRLCPGARVVYADRYARVVLIGA